MLTFNLDLLCIKSETMFILSPLRHCMLNLLVRSKPAYIEVGSVEEAFEILPSRQTIIHVLQVLFQVVQGVGSAYPIDLSYRQPLR